MIASHAQCKQRRRIENRNDPYGPQLGAPILGALTPTEIAHKARRKLRRKVILKSRREDLLHSINSCTKAKQRAEADNEVNIACCCEQSLKNFNTRLNAIQRQLEAIS